MKKVLQLTLGIMTALGSLVTVALLALGAIVFLPRNVSPELLSTTAVPAALALGHPGLLLALPLTYYPILMAAGDKQRMGKHASKRWLHVAGWVFLVLIVVAAVIALPLTFVTHLGEP